MISGQSARATRLAAALLGLPLALWSLPSQALEFNFTFVDGTPDAAKTAFINAGQIWSDRLFDRVTVKLQVGTAALGGNILGQSSSFDVWDSYASFRPQLTADRLGANDQKAVATLASGLSFPMLINRTLDSDKGTGSATPYLDNDGGFNNSVVSMTAANAKALGYDLSILPSYSGLDGSITFSNSYSWDYDRSDGIGTGLYDFTGMAAHEMGHALGFISGVDILDWYSQPIQGGPYTENNLSYVYSLDLFRYSLSSYEARAIDWTADTRDKYFSIDGGTTSLGLFSTGSIYGDLQQASHWKDSRYLGIMDPTAASGEMLSISTLDLTAFDVIGWDLAPRPVPAPLPILGALSALAWSRKLRQRIRQASTWQATTPG